MKEDKKITLQIEAKKEESEDELHDYNGSDSCYTAPIEFISSYRAIKKTPITKMKPLAISQSTV